MIKKLKVRSVGITNYRKVGFNKRRMLGQSLYSLRRAGIYYSERDLAIMLAILGDRHLCRLLTKENSK